MAKKRDMNIWHGTGRFGRKPEVKTTQSGKAVCSASIACQWDDKAEWVNLVFWDKQAEIIGQYCDKGSYVRVSGRLQTREWEKDGVKRYSTEVVVHEMQFLGSAPRKQDTQTRAVQQVQDEFPGATVVGGQTNDDIPF